MKILQTIFVVSSILFFSSQLSAQLNSDLGVRFTTSDYSKIQLEFRKPLSEKINLRFGVTEGQGLNYQYGFVSAASDTMVTTRQKMLWGDYVDLRFGFERNLKGSNFSIHSDLVFGYSQINRENSNVYYVLDSNNVWNTGVLYDPNNLGTAVTTSKQHNLGAGLCAGLSFNFPIYEHFILNLNLNYTGLIRFQIGYEENADVLNEFYADGGSTIEFYTTAGIGLRYVFGKKEKPAESN